MWWFISAYTLGYFLPQIIYREFAKPQHVYITVLTPPISPFLLGRHNSNLGLFFCLGISGRSHYFVIFKHDCIGPENPTNFIVC